jgi:cobalt/nickel transport system ATP-binding protein
LDYFDWINLADCPFVAPGGVVKEILTIKDLSFHYPDGVKALNNISLSVASGEKVAFVGANGAGKSTLLLHLNGILGGVGEVEVCSMRVNRENLNAIRAAVGLVFQDPDDQLFSPTVFEDVAFGPLYMGLSEEEVRTRAEMALELVGMKEMADRPPHNMSLGEKKRAAMATVLAMKPEILALDEPTSALDARSRRRIINILRDLPQTVVIATHDMALVSEVASRTVVLDQGELVADLVTEEVLKEKSFLEEHGLEIPGLGR